MADYFLIALDLSKIEIGITVFAGLGFIILFGISSATGGYKDLIDTTLRNDSLRRSKSKGKK